MAVIAMTREMGSLGRDVAAGLSEQMGLRVVHHELVERDLAGRLGVRESAVHHFLEGSASLFERWKIDKKKLSRYTAEEILELARSGDVLIRGWGATALLRSIPHVVCVRVCAPMSFREQVMMERLGTADRELARREIERSDAAHTRVVQSFFGVDWQNPLLYNLVLNTERLAIETCVKLVREVAESPAFQETADSRSVLADKLVGARVRSVLNDRFEGAGFGLSSIDGTVTAGKVTLTGTAVSVELIGEAERLVRQIQGVKDVENHIVYIPAHYRHG
jgi:cytidylate kinase